LAQNSAFSNNFTMLSAAQHIVPLHHVTLPGSLARQPCPADLPGRLARQPCPEAKYQIQLKILHYCQILPCLQHIGYCTIACTLAMQPCPAALPKLVQAFPAIKDIAILSLVYELILTCERE
jgi:hypothetical protein